MILAAAILLFGIYSTGFSSQETSAQTQSAPPAASSSASGNQSNAQQSGTPPATSPATNSPSASQPSTSSSSAHPSKKHVYKKKASIAPCDSGSLATNSAGSPNAANGGTGDSQQGQASATPPAKNCPPEKIIVRQGGTTEPSIQLAGGDQASQKKDAVKQMLGSTEANLKKIAGLQLSDAQKGTVVQIHQFVDQSKAALAAGDVERGNTLAWKAQLLSEDLVQPQK
jgi:hypothetical protein